MFIISFVPNLPVNNRTLMVSTGTYLDLSVKLMYTLKNTTFITFVMRLLFVLSGPIKCKMKSAITNTLLARLANNTYTCCIHV